MKIEETKLKPTKRENEISELLNESQKICDEQKKFEECFYNVMAFQ